MIGFYADSFRTLGGWWLGARVWMRSHPVAARIFAVIGIVAYLTFIQARAAHAAGFLPDGTDFVDSQGNSFLSYGKIDIDEGDVWSPGKVMVNFVVQVIWSLQYFATGVVLWLFNFLLTFEWVGWLSTPFNTLADWMQDQLGTINWIPFALVISATVAGIAIFIGRVSGGLWEMLVAAVLAVLALGILANPVATLTGTGGLLSQAQDFGGQLATAIVVDRAADASGGATMSNAVTRQLMDIFVRIPYQVISYSMVLPDACQPAFNTFIQTGEPQSSLRDCAPEAAVFAHDNPGSMNILNALVNGAGITVLFLFGMVIAVLLMVSVIFFLVAAVKAMLLVYLCILPVNREPLWRAVSDTFMGAISLVVMTVCLSLYLKLTTWFMGQTLALPHQLRMVLLVLLLGIIIFLVWRARRATLRAGRGVAGHLAGLGLGMKAQPKDSNALLKMGAVAQIAKTGYDLFRRSPSKAPALPPAAAPAASAGVQDIGEFTATRSRPAPGAPGPHGGAAPRPGGPALGAGTAKAALGAGKAAVTVAKGVASGGVAGGVAAGATVVVKGAGAKVASKAASAASSRASRPAAAVAGTPDIGELRVIQVQESAASRIDVDARGVGSARRRPAIETHDISSLPPRAPQASSSRALERRRELEAFRPKPRSRAA